MSRPRLPPRLKLTLMEPPAEMAFSAGGGCVVPSQVKGKVALGEGEPGSGPVVGKGRGDYGLRQERGNKCHERAKLDNARERPSTTQDHDP
jgi:hypothetical protein